MMGGVNYLGRLEDAIPLISIGFTVVSMQRPRRIERFLAVASIKGAARK
jgi:hypothetical protein